MKNKTLSEIRAEVGRIGGKVRSKAKMESCMRNLVLAREGAARKREKVQRALEMLDAAQSGPTKAA